MKPLAFFWTAAVAAVAWSFPVFELTERDMARARCPHVPHGSPVAGSTGTAVFESITAFMKRSSAGPAMRDCETFETEGLDTLTVKLLQHRSQVLQEEYAAVGDHRGVWEVVPTKHPRGSVGYNVSREAKCAQALMIWVHHLSDATKEHLAGTLLSLPSMPRYGPRDTADHFYTQAVRCTDCHHAEHSVAPPPEAPKAPRWGGGPDVLAFSVKVNMTDVSDSPDHPKWQFQYWYDDSVKASKYAHSTGQDDEVCRPVVNYPEPCNVTFSSDGNVYVAGRFRDGRHKCCVRNRGTWGAVRSDWLRIGGGHGPATFVNNTVLRGHPVSMWLKQGSSDNHYYASHNDPQYPDDTPVRFMEHKNGILKQWDFLMETWKPGPQDPSLFVKPEGCDQICL